jgi:uncharacterized protein YbjT (DUF2867 family)
LILVVGGTGTLGRKIAKTLLASGEDVRVMSRSLARTDELKSLGARPVRANLNDPESLEFAVRGVKTVIASAHALLGRGHESSEAIDDAGHRALIDASREAGVDHFIYTSVVGASDDHPIDFWRTKAGIERYLNESGLSHTIVRPTAFMDTHAYQLLGKNVVEGKRVVLAGKGNNPRNFVAAEDVAKVIVGAIRIPALRGETIDVGGPENLTSLEVVQIFERLSGRKAKVTYMPLGVLKAMSGVAGRAHPGVGRVMRTMIINETRDQRFDPSMLRTKIPITLTSLESWARNRIRQ